MKSSKSKGKVSYFGKSKYYDNQFVLSLVGDDKIYSIDSYKVKQEPKKGDTVGIISRGKFLDEIKILVAHVPDPFEDDRGVDPWD